MRAILLQLLILFSTFTISQAQTVQPFVVDTGVQLNPTLMEFFDDGVGFIGGYELEEGLLNNRPYYFHRGYLYKTTDGGTSWQQVWRSHFPNNYYCEPLSVTQLNGNIWGASFVDSTGVQFWYSLDAGDNWDIIDNNITTDSLYLIVEHLTEEDNEAVGIGSCIDQGVSYERNLCVAVSEDLGVTWETIFRDETHNTFQVYDRSISGDLYVGYRKVVTINPQSNGPDRNALFDKIVKFDVATGDTIELLNDTLVYMNDIDMLNDNIGYVVGKNGVFKTVDAGDTWGQEGAPFGYNFIGDELLYNEASHDVFVIGRENEDYNSRDVVVYHGAADGLRWTELLREYSDTNGSYDRYRQQVLALTPDGALLVGMFNNRFYRIDNVVGVEETELNDQLQVYPNPTDHLLQVELGIPFTGKLELFDLSGRQVLANSLQNTQNTSIDVSAFNKGVYLLKLISDDGSTTTQKIIVQ